MGETISTFEKSGLELRSIYIGNKLWFVAADVCRHLGLPLLAGAAQHTLDLPLCEKQTVRLHDGGRGQPRRVVIDEAGLHRMVIRSDTPEARAFEEWVIKEVISTISESDSH